MQQKDNVTITKHHAFLYKKNQFFNYGGLSSWKDIFIISV